MDRYNDPLKEYRRQQELIHKVIDNPVKEWMRQKSGIEAFANTSVEKLIKQKLEITRLFNNPINQWQKHKLSLDTRITPIFEKLQKQQDIIKKAFGSVFELLKQAEQDFEKYKILMVKLNFPPHQEMDFKEFKGMYDFYITEGEEMAKEKIYQLILNNYTNDRIVNILENWRRVDWLGGRITILEESILNYIDGRYYSAISTLLPQIEGIIIERGNVTGYVSQKALKNLGAKILDETGSFSLDEAIKLFYIDCVLDSFEHGQSIKSPLSRHAILHGADTNFGFEINALRCILFFDYLVSKLIEQADVGLCKID
jgi:hypothetical protein